MLFRSQAKALIAISAHTGLLTKEEKKQRAHSDALWKERLCTLDSKSFLSLWYQQEVFSSLQKDPKHLASLLKKRRYNNGKELSLVLEELSPIKAPLYTPSCPTLFLYGEEDKKYKALYETFSFSKEISPGGHALIEENPQEVLKEIQHFLQKENLCKQH